VEAEIGAIHRRIERVESRRRDNIHAFLRNVEKGYHKNGPVIIPPRRKTASFTKMWNRGRVYYRRWRHIAQTSKQWK